ncbi:MAG: hypothetical protein DLD55_02710 [candidate division SR1 bacterium]|nr:MAG: hypothetical protein DLD55_02710 [candidate division SR1 bacterium]
MQRIGVLNGNNITYDHDLAGLVRGLTDGGVIQGGEISENKVQPVQAVIACQRSNGQKLMLYFESNEQVAIPSSGTFKVYIEVNQAKIDDGSENAENGTGIAEIKTGPTLPSQNFLLLASVAAGQVKDERNLIPKIQSVAQRTDSLEEKLSTAEGQISQLVEAGTPSYLGITAIVGEKYTMEDTLFLQKTPTLADSTIAINVGDAAANKEQHIQRIASGTASNQLKLKIKKFGAPTTSVVVEVRKGVKVDVSDKEAYRYGGEVVATTTIAYTQFTTEWKEFTLTLNNQFGAIKGELLDIVVYQQGGIVNEANYYQIACDSTQYSEAFSGIFVNGSERARHKLMPYCISEAFFTELLVKEKKETYKAKIIENEAVISGNKATFANSVKGKNVVFDITFESPVTGVYLWEKHASGGFWSERVSANSGKLEKTKENLQTIGHFGFSNSSSSWDSSPYNIASGKVYTYKEVSVVRSVYQQVGYVEGTHNLGEKVKFILFGVVNGVWYNDRRSLIVNKTISGNATAQWTAPTSGFILCYWTSQKDSYGDSYAQINGKKLTITYYYSENRGLFFVEKGSVQIMTAYNRGHAPTLTIEEFIPL